MHKSSYKQLYVNVQLETSMLVSKGFLSIEDPKELSLHRQLASPLIKSGHCDCNPSFMPLVNAEDHFESCIYYYNKYRCFCHHCAGISGTPERCVYGAKSGYFPKVEEEIAESEGRADPCKKKHCWAMNPRYTRKVCMQKEPPEDSWICSRCLKTQRAPTPGESRVEEVSDDEETKRRKRIAAAEAAFERQYKRRGGSSFKRNNNSKI